KQHTSVCGGIRLSSFPVPRFDLHIMVAALLFGVVWSVTGDECLPGGNLFGILLLLFCAVVAGKLFGLIKIPTLPPLPPLLGMLLAGFVLHNVPVVNTAVNISQKWSSSLRSIALAVILTRAGLGLDAKALRKLKAVCACSVAVLSHFLLLINLKTKCCIYYIAFFQVCLGAVSPAVVVPSMLILQKDGYGVEQGVPTLLMAAGSFDDILAITGFNTCLGIAFFHRGSMEVVGGIIAGVAMGFFCDSFQKSLVVKRSTLLLGLAVFAVFGSGRAGFPGSGGLCTLVMSFLAGVGWGVVEDIVGVAWNIFQPLLFGLIGAEISITSLNPNTVGKSQCAFNRIKKNYQCCQSYQ
uniref:Cation/H+ exchanger domain-containing protein n=1 Tax=Erpetoichthys calabaricus TaxID=27687 RepID=A0A8C4SXM0_ERPCA